MSSKKLTTVVIKLIVQIRNYKTVINEKYGVKSDIVSLDNVLFGRSKELKLICCFSSK